MNQVDRAAVQDLLRDADGFLAYSTNEVAPGPAMLEMVVNLRAAYLDLSHRSMRMTMTADQKIAFLLRLDRLRAILQLFGESV